MKSIVNASAIANEIQIPSAPNTQANMIAREIGNTRPSRNEIMLTIDFSEWLEHKMYTGM